MECPMMEGLIEKLDISKDLLDILDGIRSLPSARSEHEILANMIRCINEEIESVQTSITETKQLVDVQKDLLDGWEDLENHLQRLIVRHQSLPLQETPMIDSGFRQRCSRSNSARALRSLHGPLGDDSSLCSVEPLENSDGGIYGLQTSVMSSISSRSSRQTHLMDMTNYSQRLNGTSLSWSRAASTPLPSNRPVISPAPIVSASRGGTPPPRRGLDASISYISKNDFSSIPQYMRGRIKYDEINAVIDKYNEVLNKKLAICKKGKTSKTKSDVGLLIRWKEQSTSVLEGEYYVNGEDFASLSDYKLSKKDFSILTILRHVKKIREVRNGKIIFYVAVF